MLMALSIPARTGAAPGTDGSHYLQQEHGEGHCGHDPNDCGRERMKEEWVSGGKGARLQA